MKRPRSIVIVALIGLVSASLAVWQLWIVPSWLEGDWAPDNALMRYLYQCAGTREQEQIRWMPDEILVSACDGPVQLAMSPSQGRVLIWVRSSNEYRVYDVASGEMVFTTSSVPYFEGGFVGEDYLFVRAGEGGLVPGVSGNNIIDLATETRTPITSHFTGTFDTTVLQHAYAESNGRVIRVDGAIQAFLFFGPSGIREAHEYSPFPPDVEELAARWAPPTLKSTFENLKDDRVFGGGESCVLGDNRFVGDQNPLSVRASQPTCLLNYANPVWLVD